MEARIGRVRALLELPIDFRVVCVLWLGTSTNRVSSAEPFLQHILSEHCVRVSQLCRPEDALWGLLHDASEAYLSDVAAPLKKLPEFGPYRAAERTLQRIIAQRFGLPPEQPASVGEADRRLLRIEARDLLGRTCAERPRGGPARGRLALTAPWQPRVAKSRFLSRFRELCWKA